MPDIFYTLDDGFGTPGKKLKLRWRPTSPQGVDGAVIIAPNAPRWISSTVGVPTEVEDVAATRWEIDNLGAINRHQPIYVDIPPGGGDVTALIRAAIGVPPEAPVSTLVAAAQDAAAVALTDPDSEARAALDAAYAPKWLPSTAYTAGALVMLPAPINGPGTRNSNGTSRASFDATEQGAWTATGGGLDQATADELYAPIGIIESGILTPFLPDVQTEPFFTALDTPSPSSATDVTAVLYGDSTGNQTDEWWAVAWNSVRALWSEWRVLYYPWNTATETYPSPTVWQAGTPVGGPSPINTTVATDLFSRTGELIGSAPTTGDPWEGTPGYYTTNGSRLTYIAASGLTNARLPFPAYGAVTFTGTVRISTVESASKQSRIIGKYIDENNFIYVNFVGAASTTVTIQKRVAGTLTTIATLTAAIPPNTAAADYPFSITIDGTAVSATVNGVTATATLTTDDATVFANATRVGLGSNSPTFEADGLGVAVNGFSTGGSYNTLHLYNASVPGSRLDHQQTRLVAMTPRTPNVAFISPGHNYTTDTPSVFLPKVQDFVDDLRELHPGVPVVCTSQNPEFAPATNAVAHNARQRALRPYAKQQGWGYIPGYEVFAMRADGGVACIQSDGLHPTFGVPSNNGSGIWADAALQYLRARSERAA
ncbi:tail fiber protein [Gordonia phage Matteo]|uniref:Minor tail protein n=1 Tax=Gordonia phage Matteo TaxID=2759392 RepID=A0A7L7STX7_9CAUD|nr:tail fiber protein [Gordonia phage Matteo]QOC55955.1 minor tail protein [Gordonia phage Matteo]